MKLAIFTPSCCLGLFLTAGAAGQSVTLIDNLAEPVRDRSEIFHDEFASQWAAQSFYADAAYTLDLVELLVGEATSSTVGVAYLFGGETTPDTYLTTLVVPTLPAGPDEVVALSPVDVVSLVAGETYWVVVGVELPGFYKWAYAEGNNWSGPGAFGAYAYSVDAGASWANYGYDNPFQMRISASASGCYADCDASGSLDFFDFLCFQNEFNIASSYADCDASGSLDFFDFLCFQNEFNLGCP